MMRFVFWMMRRISTEQHTIPLKNKRKLLVLAPFEFMYGRNSCAKNIGISEGKARRRLEQLLALGYLSKVSEKTTSTFSVFRLEVTAFRQNSSQHQGQKTRQQTDSFNSLNRKTKTSDCKIKEASIAIEESQVVDKSPLSEKEKEDVQVIVAFCEQRKITLKKRVVIRWLLSYGVQRILDHVGLLMENKKCVKNPEAWLETAIKENYVWQNQNTLENKQYAEQFKMEKNWTDLEITKAYCTHKPSGKDYQFKLPPESFRQILLDCYNQYKSGN